MWLHPHSPTISVAYACTRAHTPHTHTHTHAHMCAHTPTHTCVYAHPHTLAVTISNISIVTVVTQTNSIENTYINGNYSNTYYIPMVRSSNSGTTGRVQPRGFSADVNCPIVTNGSTCTTCLPSSMFRISHKSM